MKLITDHGELGTMRHLTFGLHPLLGVLKEESIDYSGFLARAEISRETLRTPGSTITPAQELSFIIDVINCLQRPELGFEIAKRYRLSSYGLLGLAASSSKNLRSCYEIFIENVSLTFTYHEYTFETKDELLYITLEPIRDLGEAFRFMADRDLGAVHNIAVEAVGCDLPIVDLELKHDAGSYLDLYKAKYDCPIRDNATRNRLTIEKHWLERPLVNSEPDTSRIFLQQCRQIATAMRTKQSFSEYIRSFLIDSNFESQTLNSISKKLNTSPRTIQRKLAKENTGFQFLLDEIRSNLSCEYLLSTDHSIEEIAFRLGFNDAAALSNAFKRWKGIYPSHYRKQG